MGEYDMVKSYDAETGRTTYNSSKYLETQNAAFAAAREKYVELTCMFAEFQMPADVDRLISFAKKMYGTFDNAHFMLNKGDKAFSIDASIFHKGEKPSTTQPSYTLYNCISVEYQKGDLNRLAEDLTMAEYTLRGGKKYTYIPFLVTSIQNSISEQMGRA